MNRATHLVAVVDDEESVRRALKRLICSAGLDVETFPSGDEFLETIAELKPDCVVLDLHMPKVDGFKVQSWMRRAGLDVPVIIITGHDSPEAQIQCLKSGACAYLRKPVDGDALLNAIERAIQSRKN